MVTGVETAGLVLGSLPILLEAMKVYQSGIQRTMATLKYHKTLNQIHRDVEGSKILFEDNMQILFKAAGLIDEHEGDLGDYAEDYWRNMTTGVHGGAVEKYLGEEKLLHFQHLVADFKSTLIQLTNALYKVHRAHMKEPKREDLSLEDIRKLAVPLETIGHHVSKRLSLLWNKETLENLVNGTHGLENLNNKMEKILESTERVRRHGIKSRQMSTIISDEKKARDMVSALRLIRAYTDRLFEAFRRAWASSCHPFHDVALFLDAPPFSFKSVPVQFNFRTLLSERPDPIAVPELWHEASVTVVEDGGYGRQFSASTEITITPSMEITDTESMDPLSPSISDQVQNLCKEVEQAKIAHKSLQLLLRHGRSLIRHDQNSQSKQNSAVPWNTVTLEQLLPSQRIHPKQRVTLALKLAASLLQLKASQWLVATWSSKTIYFPTSGTNERNRRADLEQPLIVYTFSGSSQIFTGESEPRKMFFELGVLLMEIWNEESLAQYALRVHADDLNGRHVDEVSPLLREAIANERFRATRSQMTERYGNVIKTCLCFAVHMVSNWDDDTLWKSACANIIGPLHEDCLSFPVE